MKSNKKDNKRLIIMLIIVLIITSIIIGFVIYNKNKKTKKEPLPYDDMYWNMKRLYETEDTSVDLVNNNSYYTLNIYIKDTDILISSTKIDAYTGEMEEEKDQGIEETSSMIKYKD